MKSKSQLSTSEIEQAIRSELFSVDRLEEHARSLARAQIVTDNPRSGLKLMPRIEQNAKILNESYSYMAEALRQKRAVTPAAEWLVDSFHVVEEQLRDVKAHLPTGFYNELPKVAEGFLKRYPRVYGLAWAYVAHTDSRFEPDLLVSFVRAYQGVQPLLIGELWAIAITLRVVMLENLRRMAVLIVTSQKARESADQIADELLGLAGESPVSAEAKLAALRSSNGTSQISISFLVQLLQRFHYQDAVSHPVVNWLSETLVTQNQSADGIVAQVHQSQAASNLTVRNIITSFRSMSAFDWQEFFEKVSLVHDVLQTNADYPLMDFVTRDRYRHAIEDLSRGSRIDEIAVAKAAVAKAHSQESGPGQDPGYFLISKGRTIFEKDLGYRISRRTRFRRFYTGHPTAAYLGSLFVLIGFFLWLPFAMSHLTVSVTVAIVLGILGFFPASDLALSVLNRFVTELMGPRHLPRFKLTEGPAVGMRTFVVVPTLLAIEERILAQFEQLEVHYLSNPEGDVRFALLTDWGDSDTESKTSDSIQFEIATRCLNALNERHGAAPDGGPRFYFLHRKRLWNPSENKWIGWERKRGKLHEFNRLLRGATDTSYLPLAKPLPQGVRFVITLDADTKLPKGSVSQLVGTLSHRLNRATVDFKSNKVVEGYGVLQPRVTAALPARGENTLFQRLFAGECGIDPYASAVSDVYQDLFGEGSFTGKGIYDVDAFEQVLKNRVPENSLLSHDLFEGSYARSGYISDVEFFEEFPSHSEVSSARNHRWIRGDWQLLPWIFGRRGRDLSLISRWKMLDNLRRSVSPVANVLLIVFSFSVLESSFSAWVSLVLASLIFPPFTSFVMTLIPRRKRIALNDYLRELGEELALGLGHLLVSLILLAHRAWVNFDAIARALWRRFVSRKHLLEWVTAAQVKQSSSLELKSFVYRLKGAVFLSAAATAIIVFFNPEALKGFLPFATVWCLSPLFACFISMPPSVEETLPLSELELSTLRGHARKVWRFFATFVTSEDHYLPPDNFQEDPAPVVAHRSSPTNFGLYLLSTVAAHDFSWIGLTETVERLEQSMETLLKLPRFRGHFFNWYETRDLRVLEPKYVSAVDSGNLAGHLLTLAQSCLGFIQQPLLNLFDRRGIVDNCRLLSESLAKLPDSRGSALVPLSQLQEALSKLQEKLEHTPALPADQVAYWDALELRAETLKDMVSTFAQDRGDAARSEVTAWGDAIAGDIKSHTRDLHSLLPWAQYLGKHTLLVKPTPEESKHWAEIERLLTLDLCLSDVSTRCRLALVEFRSLKVSGVYYDQFTAALEHSIVACSHLVQRLNALSASSRKLFDEMEFGFLLNPKKRLFSIGYRVHDDQLDESCYDLLASEARLTSYVAIAKGDVPVSHWFRLGRGIVPVERGAALISWSGSMFEYLMPSLVMFTPRGSLLDQTCRLIVKRQIQYGAERGVPWGISESAYNVRDLELTYQYSNFGVPGLGLKRGLGNDLVIAPYATALALMYDPKAAMQNFSALQSANGAGPFGFYESLDYTPSRLPENSKAAVIRAYMAHHQGMALIAFANLAHNGLMRRRFHADPLVQSTELLLQERTPKNIGSAKPRLQEVEIASIRDLVQPVIRRLRSPNHPVPSSHLLSNGRYAVMITAAGSGFSRWKNLAITRWREDVTRDHYGSYFYLRDMKSGAIWSASYQPTLVEPEQSEIVFSEDRARIRREDRSIVSLLEIIVSPEDDAELRRLTLTNTGSEAREIEVTSYLEPVLASAASDLAHPAFSNLFIQTEFVPGVKALLASRRPRSSKETRNFIGQVLSTEAETFGGLEYETDRAKFIGRGRTLVRPVSVEDGRPLSNTVGSVIDPVLSMRVRVKIRPGAAAQVCFTTLAANSREEVIRMAEKYHAPGAFERSSTLAWTHAQVQLHYLGIDPAEAEVFQKLANRVLYLDPLMRPASQILKRNELNVTGLWGRGISGDNPIILVRIDDPDDQLIIRQLLRAHEYWRRKRLAVDIVILNSKATSYAQDFQVALETMVRGSLAISSLIEDQLGKFFVLRHDLLSQQERDLLLTYSRVILNSRQGTLAEQVMRMRKPEEVRELVVQDDPEIHDSDLTDSESYSWASELDFYNGLGGFTPDGREYVIILRKGQRTPVPWINVISNERFGFQVSESGCGYTWSMNSRENQITPWSNDPILDPPGEAIYFRDLNTGHVWSPTAAPIRYENATYVARHGSGYSTFEHKSNGIRSELLQFVSIDDPIKISKITLENSSSRTRKLSVTGYVEWVLGFSRSQTMPYVITEIDPETGAVFAFNPLNTEFGKRISFFDLNGTQESWTGDRSEFIGRNGSLEKPAALFRQGELSQSVGAGLDPCGVLQTTLVLQPGQVREVVLFLGQAEDRDTARALIKKYRKANLANEKARVDARWDELLGKIQVRTPDRSMDLLLNRWVLYQTIACRFLARAAFYQAGGAYGFRDQLQDVMAIAPSDPLLARNHILRAAARQFVEGDVQHWWHPPSGRGVRTHFSDDLLWLPYVALHYMSVTNDSGILEEEVPFIEGALLAPEKEDAYFEPRVSDQWASLYEHCARTIDRSLRTGIHDLPLMGTGDWNDGMNRVGAEGKGESIWVGWFLHNVLTRFSVYAEKRGETERLAAWRTHAAKLKVALESHGWDGQWYRRAYFDDGTPLGSSMNEECRIDSIAQTWSILSGAGDPVRSVQAMESVERHLVRSSQEMILLFSPPFDSSSVDPGYIKGYVPGVRENGGQYTHAAVWCVMAYGGLGNGSRAHELFAMLNPINHTSRRTGVYTYKAEPYVLAADIYGEPPHVGRGGWSWYTGSSGWMYRAGIESILGIYPRGKTLFLNPCIPRHWDRFEASYRFGGALYEIEFENPVRVSRGITLIEENGVALDSGSATLKLIDDGKVHRIRVVLG